MITNPTTGEWDGGLKHGRGTYQYPSGDVYEGEWSFGQRSGHGTYTWAATQLKVLAQFGISITTYKYY